MIKHIVASIRAFIAKIVAFMSERDGTPSMSRLTMGWLAFVGGAVLIVLAIGVLKSDLAKAAAILAALPAIIAALTVFIPSPYAVNRFTENKQKPLGDKPTQEEKQ